MLPESPQEMAIQINQNEKDMGTEIEDDYDDNERSFNDGIVDALISSLAESINSASSNGAA